MRAPSSFRWGDLSGMGLKRRDQHRDEFAIRFASHYDVDLVQYLVCQTD